MAREFPEPREIPVTREFPRLKLFPPVSREMGVSRELPDHGFPLNITDVDHRGFHGGVMDAQAHDAAIAARTQRTT